MSGRPTLEFSHVRFYAEDADESAAALMRESGLQPIDSAPWPIRASERVLWMRAGEAVGAVIEPVEEPRSVAYLTRHGFGVADIVLETPNVARTFAELTDRGVKSVREPELVNGHQQAVVAGFGDVLHTLVEPVDADTIPTPVSNPAKVCAIDHFALLVPGGQLESTVAYYEHGFGFDKVFSERTEVGDQAMNSWVVTSAGRSLTLTILEPDLSLSPGPVDSFLKNHVGAGVQHIAYRVEDIVHAVDSLNGAGVKFLDTPDAYYEALPARVPDLDRDIEDLRRLGILADQDHGGHLYQIFAHTQHPQRSSFAEIIERRGARLFGKGNIAALYDAVRRVV